MTDNRGTLFQECSFDKAEIPKVLRNVAVDRNQVGRHPRCDRSALAVSPYRGDHTNDVTNGLLLRADIHTLFDCGLIKVDGDYRITADDHICEIYDLPAMITLPTDKAWQPSPEALNLKWKDD